MSSYFRMKVFFGSMHGVIENSVLIQPEVDFRIRFYRKYPQIKASAKLNLKLLITFTDF
jgi:hypothetical protein